MEWGIINKINFKDKTTYDIPIKRWDPLSIVTIRSKDFGLRKEHVRYYGHYAYLAPIRGKRPKGFEKKVKIFFSSPKMEKTRKNRTNPIIKLNPINISHSKI